MSSSQHFDIESPKSVDLSSPKSDECSVDTHPSESDDSSEALSVGSSQPNPLRKLLLVALLTTIVALSVGLGVGLTLGRRQSESSSRLAVVEPATSAPIDIAVESSTARPEEPQDLTTTKAPLSPGVEEENEEETAIRNPTQEEESPDNKPPSGFSGLGAFAEGLSWPELVGLPGDQAKQILDDLDEGYLVVLVPSGSATTKDLREDRIFLFLNEEGYVERVPRTGR